MLSASAMASASQDLPTLGRPETLVTPMHRTWSMKNSTGGICAASRSARVTIGHDRWRVAACADPRGSAAAFAGAAHEGDEAVVGAVEFLVGLLDGGRPAGGVGAKEPLNRGAPAAVGAGARLRQGGGRGAVEQAADGIVRQLAGALAALWPGLLAKFMH